MKNQRISLLLIFFLFIGFFSGMGFLLGQEYHGQSSQAPFDLKLLNNVYRAVEDNFLFADKVKTKQLEYGAIKGFVGALGDPYTYFMDPEETKNFFEVLNGSFEGIGAEVGVNEQREIVIVAPLEGTPAKKAGLLPGDVIMQIEDKTTLGMTLDAAIANIRGPKGTTLTLLIKRALLPAPLEISLVREVIKIPTLAWKTIESNQIAYIQLFNFNEGLSKQFAEVAQEILNSGVKKIVLDLRGNPGGLLQEAIDVGGWFIEKDGVVALERFSSGEVREYKSKRSALLKGFPLVVLIDSGSASASEILAGALKVSNNALLVGEKSFGKGTVQLLDQEFPDHSSLRVTTSQWLLPSGASINKEGLMPDIQVTREKVNDPTDLSLQKAIEVLLEKQ